MRPVSRAFARFAARERFGAAQHAQRWANEKRAARAPSTRAVRVAHKASDARAPHEQVRVERDDPARLHAVERDVAQRARGLDGDEWERRMQQHLEPAQDALDGAEPVGQQLLVRLAPHRRPAADADDVAQRLLELRELKRIAA